MSKAIVYIAYGKQYLKEVLRSVDSLNGQFPVVVCTLNGKQIDGVESFRLPRRKHPKHWFLDRCYYFNLIINELDYDQILLLDTDTFVCGDLSGYFSVLDRFDIVGTQAISQQTLYRYNIPPSFPELHCGAFSFNCNGVVKRLFERWFEIYQKRPAFFGNDQPALRQALWEMDYVKLGILPAEYCFRYRWGGLLSKQVVLLHGKEHNTPYEEVVEQVNAKSGIRVYLRRELA